MSFYPYLHERALTTKLKPLVHFLPVFPAWEKLSMTASDRSDPRTRQLWPTSTKYSPIWISSDPN